ncbi:MAG: hypothetical protein PHR35_21785, partial [Kiritimatiellae bacterium]|nr:hypothetical protein [Kiritimatiellia bacterium]
MNRKLRRMAGSVSVMGLVLCGGTAWAEVYNFNVTSGDWGDANSWSPNTGFPGAADTAGVTGGRTAIVSDAESVSILTLATAGTVDIQPNGDLQVSSNSSIVGTSGTGTVLVAGRLALAGADLGNGGVGRIVQSGGTITSSAALYVGRYGGGESGRVDQNGGTNYIASMYLGYNAGNSGRYTISAGALTAPSIYMGFFGNTAGRLTLAGGVVNASSVLVGAYNGCEGLLIQSNGVLNAS